MKIKNKKNSANYVNFKDNGIPKKIIIAAGVTANIPALTKVSQITNYGDFKRGFFEIVDEAPVNTVVVATEKKAETTKKKSTSTKKKKDEDSLEKVEKEVKNYTDNEE
jgi:hypothetical protein